MKRRLILVLMAVGALVFGNSFAAAHPIFVDFWAGQFWDAGGVYVYNTETDLKVTILTNPGWKIVQSSVSVHITANLIPQTKSHNPKVGKFEWSAKTPPTSGYTYSIPLSSIDGGVAPGTELCIAVHSVLQNTNNPEWEETAWAGCGENKFDFGGNSWAVYFKYTLQ